MYFHNDAVPSPREEPNLFQASATRKWGFTMNSAAAQIQIAKGMVFLRADEQAPEQDVFALHRPDLCSVPLARAGNMLFELSQGLLAAIAAVVSAAGYRELDLQYIGSLAGAPAPGYPAVLFARATAPHLLSKYTGVTLVTRQDVLIITAQHDPGSLRAKLRTDPAQPDFVAIGGARWGDDRRGLPERIVRQVCARSLASPGCEIFLIEEGFEHDQVRDLIDGLRVLPIRIWFVPGRKRGTRAGNQERADLYALELQRPPMSRFQRAAKRALDLVLSGTALVVLAPLLVLIALAIRLDSNGPVVFCQRRLGRYGRPFTIFKFRTMHVEEDGPDIKQATRDDPRVTRVGRTLRRLSLDELPQLINVLRGEMSLVGPRPHAIVHDRLFAQAAEHYEVRQYVKPGITGWAQANGLRGETLSQDSVRRRIEYDRHYACNASLWLDLKILVLTVRELFNQEHAY